jgi:ElaB/YqjD/DUF883 family membrane-anchored ribosome-binding protein
MSELSFRLEKEFEKLKQRRDELSVQLDLGRKEIQDTWNAVDDRWGELENRMRLWGQLTSQTAEEVSEAAEAVVDDAKRGLEATADEVKDSAKALVAEVREGFERLRSLV